MRRGRGSTWRGSARVGEAWGGRDRGVAGAGAVMAPAATICGGGPTGRQPSGTTVGGGVGSGVVDGDDAGDAVADGVAGSGVGAGGVGISESDGDSPGPSDGDPE